MPSYASSRARWSLDTDLREDKEAGCNGTLQCAMVYVATQRTLFRNMLRCLGLSRRYLDWFECLLYLFVEPTPVFGPLPLLFANPSILSRRNDPRSSTRPLHGAGRLLYTSASQ